MREKKLKRGASQQKIEDIERTFFVKQKLFFKQYVQGL